MNTQFPERIPCAARVVVTAVTALLPAVGAAGMEWDITPVHESLLWVRDTVSIAVDADGRPHIADCTAPGGIMTYARPQLGGWFVEQVEGWYSGHGAAIALDPLGVPCVTYGFGNPDVEDVELTFARRGISGWVKEPVDLMTYDTPTALCFDADGYAHIAYCDDASPFGVRYASETELEWTLETADAGPSSGFDISMVFDADGNARICHWQSVSTGVGRQELTSWNGSGWESYDLDTVGSCNVIGSGIAVGPDGDLHVTWQSHRCEIPGALRYARLTPEGWEITTVHAAFSLFSGGCSIAVDRLGNPHVIYGTKGQLVGGESQLRYAHLDENGTWVHELLDGDGDCGEINDVAIDASGYLHVAYYAGDGYSQYGEVRYARSIDPVASPLGDLNCDGVVNAFDIDPFVLALADPAGYAASWPDCDVQNGDINGDGNVDVFDIDPFIELLTRAQ